MWLMNETKANRCRTRTALTWVIALQALILSTLGPALLAGEFSVPSFSKVFTPNTMGPGSVSTITFTINNQNPIPVAGLSFTDNLPVVPSSLLIADPGNPSTSCDMSDGGILSAPDGGSTISLSNARIGAGQTCTVTVDVTAATVGVYTNPAVTLNTEIGSRQSLPIDLTVSSGLPGFTKGFSPSTVSVGGRSTLTLTIDNTANGSGLAQLSFIDVLPSGLLIADPANAFTDCGNATFPPELTALAGTSLISLGVGAFLPTFPSLAAGAACVVSVDVTASTVGELDNISDDLLVGGVSAGIASATLTVTAPALAIRKSFVDDPVPPGGAVTLDFIIDNLDRNFPATNVAFTDDLGAVLPGLTFGSLLSNDCGGSVTGAGGTLIDFSGGALAAESSCRLSVSLDVPPGATPGAYTNTTGSVSADINGDLVTGNQATELLFVEPIPTFTMQILEAGTLAPDPVINAGDDLVLRYTIANTSSTSAATDVTFIDELTDAFIPGIGPSGGFLPFPVSVTLPPIPDPPCGDGSSLALAFIDTDRQGLQLTNGVLQPVAGMGMSTCQFDVTVSTPGTLPPGLYENFTGPVEATVDGATRLGRPASDTVTVIAAPSLSKDFVDPVGPGVSTTLNYTLSYPADATGNATDITFTDDLTPLAGLVATGLPIAGACDPDGPGPIPGTGTLSGSAGDTMLAFVDGTLQPGESCTISVDIDIPAAAASGSYAITSSIVSATVEGVSATSPAASDTLDVSGLVFTKEFLGDPAIAGETLTLRFTIDNVHPTLDATLSAAPAAFTDELINVLSGLTATGSATTNECGGTLTGTTILAYAGGTVLSGTSCQIEVEVLVPPGAPDGVYNNVTSALLADQGGGVLIDPAVDTLTVDSARLALSREFTDDPVPPGDPVTLEYTLTNLDADLPATDIDFTDDLGATLADLTFDSVLFDDCGGTVSGIASGLVTVDGASLAGGSSCTVRISAGVPALAAAGVYPGTTSAVTGTMNALPITGPAAAGELEVVQRLDFSKAFAAPVLPTGTVTLTYTITNPGVDAAAGLAFTEDLNAVLPGLVASSLPAVPCGAGSALTGTSFLTFNGGDLPPMGSCSFDVEILVPVSVVPGDFVSASSPLFQGGLRIADPANATLQVIPLPPAFAKDFAPALVGLNIPSTLTFTIDNSQSLVAAPNLDFTDNLPAGMTVATPPGVANSCGGTLTADAGTSVISLSGGSVADSASCTVAVDVVADTAGSLVNVSGDLTSDSGNSGSASATLTVNGVPPRVTGIAIPGGPLNTCDNLRQELTEVTISIVDDGLVANADDPANYRIIAAGPDGDFSTDSCAVLGDDQPVNIDSVLAVGTDSVQATLSFRPLNPGLHRVVACDSIVDDAGNALDGDNDMQPGGSFLVPFFRADPFNLFENGHFDDCPVTLDPWTTVATPPNGILPGQAGVDDSDGSPVSASLRISHTVSGQSAIAQCVPVRGDARYRLFGRYRYDAAPQVPGTLTRSCSFFNGPNCAGSGLGSIDQVIPLGDPVGVWLKFEALMQSPGNASSVECEFSLQDLGADPNLELFLDGLILLDAFPIFRDGFETAEMVESGN